jgi:hypothetical protein
MLTDHLKTSGSSSTTTKAGKGDVVQQLLEATDGCPHIAVIAGKDFRIAELTTSLSSVMEELEGRNAAYDKLEKESKAKLAAAAKKQDDMKAAHVAEVKSLRDAHGSEMKTLRDRFSQASNDAAKAKVELAKVEALLQAAQKALEKSKKETNDARESNKLLVREKEKTHGEFQALLDEMTANHEAELAAARKEVEEANERVETMKLAALSKSLSLATSTSRMDCSLCLEPYEATCIAALPCKHVQACGRPACKKLLEGRPTCLTCNQAKKIDFTIYLP